MTGAVTRTRDEQPWALSSGERVPVRQVITTGSDGYAHFVVAGGGNFDLFSNSQVMFRQNVASAGRFAGCCGGAGENSSGAIGRDSFSRGFSHRRRS